MSPRIVCHSIIITLSILSSLSPLITKADYIIAEAFEYQDENIICSGNEACLIYCKEESSCENAKIFCPVNEHCIVSCGKSSNACYGALIDARYSSVFELSDCASGDSSTCSAMTIYFPPNEYGQKRSLLQVGNNFKSQLIFYAIFGWDDIDISGYNGNYNQIDAEMYCQYGYTQHCTISNTRWICSNPAHPCNNPLNSTSIGPSSTAIPPNTTIITTTSSSAITINTSIISTPPATTHTGPNFTFLKVLKSIELSWYIIALLISIMLCCSCCMVLFLYHFTQQQQRAISLHQHHHNKPSQHKHSFASNPPEPSTSHAHHMTILDAANAHHHLIAPKSLTIVAPKSNSHLFQNSPMSELTSPSTIPCYQQSSNNSASKLTQQTLPKPTFDRKSKSSPPFPQVPVPPVHNPVSRAHRTAFLEAMAANTGDLITPQNSVNTNSTTNSTKHEETHKRGFSIFHLPKRRNQTIETDRSLPPLNPAMNEFCIPSNSSQRADVEEEEEPHDVDDGVNVNECDEDRSVTEEFHQNDGFENQFKNIMNNISEKLNAETSTPQTPEPETQDDLLSNATVYPKSPGASAFATTEATQLSEVTSPHHGSNDSFQWRGIDGDSNNSVIKAHDLPPPPHATHTTHTTHTHTNQPGSRSKDSSLTATTTKSPFLKPLVSPITKSPLSTITTSSTPTLTLKITDVSGDTHKTMNTMNSMNTMNTMNSMDTMNTMNTMETTPESVTVTVAETSDAASMTYMTATTNTNPPHLTLSANTGSNSASSDSMSTPVARSGTVTDEGDDDDDDMNENDGLLKVPHGTSATLSSSDDDPRVDTISILSLSNDPDGNSINRSTSSGSAIGTDSGSTHSSNSDATVMFGDSSSAASSAASSGNSSSIGSNIVGLIDMRANEGTMDDVGISQSWLTDIIEDGDNNDKESSIPIYVQDNGTFHTDKKIPNYDTVDGNDHERKLSNM